jgi:hypothetical protein
MIKSGSVENWDLFFQHYRKSRAWREHLLRSALQAHPEKEKPEPGVIERQKQRQRKGQG